MNKEDFKKLLFSLPVSVFKSHGPIVSFVSIYDACSSRGLDIKELIHARLIELERDNAIRVVYDDHSGFEDLIIGIKLYEPN
ncbi:hypothetical protein H6F38_04670 [Paenibacillus sp. EKM208P]|nr:hypothetical protein H6F38_04670 [Paenibacillus sp. EKM208P]